MIDTHKNVIRYQIQHELNYINKYVNNPTSLQMAWISLIDEKLDQQNNGRNIIFKLKKKCGDTPSATLTAA